MRKFAVLLFLIGCSLPMIVLAQGGLSSDQIEEISRSVVLIAILDNNNEIVGNGSGTIVDSTGTILTNRHVAEAGVDYAIYLVDDVSRPPVLAYHAELIGVSPDADLAVLEIDRDDEQDRLTRSDIGSLDLPFYDITNIPRRVRVGDDVTFLGFPAIAEGSLVVTRGSISSVVEGEVTGETIEAFYLTDATIAGGNSGGLAVNGEGEFVGVPTFALVDDRAGGQLGGIVTAEAVELVLSDTRDNLVSLENWFVIRDEQGQGNDGGGGNASLFGGVALDCGRGLEFNNGVEFQIVLMRAGFTYTARVIGLNGFDPVVAVYESGTLRNGTCVDDSPDMQGYEVNLPTTGRIRASRTDAMVRFDQRSGDSLKDMSITIGGVNDMAGDFVLLLEGMAVTEFDGYGDPFRVLVTPGVVGRGTPLFIYMLGISSRLDPLTFLHDGNGNVFTLDDGTEIFCDDAGDSRGCWGDAGTSDFNMNGYYVERGQGQLLDGDSLDAALIFPVSSFTDVTVDEPLIFDLAMTGAGGSRGEYMIVFQVGTQ
jgi:hypothetical protein